MEVLLKSNTDSGGGTVCHHSDVSWIIVLMVNQWYDYNAEIIWSQFPRVPCWYHHFETNRRWCFFYRLNFIPNKNEVRLSRRDSYTPDPQLEQEVQEILSHQEEEQQRLEKIVEEVNGHNNLLATSPTEYHLTDIKPRRSRQFRSSVYIKVKAGEEKTRERAAKKRADEA